jgi:hypothetical protein
MKKLFISRAVERRLAEVRQQRALKLKPQNFGEMNEFVSSVRETLMNGRLIDLKSLASLVAFDEWMATDDDCLSSIRLLSLGKPIRLRKGSHPPVEPFLQTLSKAAGERKRLFDLFVERYSCPLNLSSPAENEVREYLLTRLMVADRGRLENGSVAIVDADDLLLKLNLVAVHAALAPDLRFLDALNYYYELLPTTWHPDTENGWLLASYLALYARALISWS